MPITFKKALSFAAFFAAMVLMTCVHNRAHAEGLKSAPLLPIGDLTKAVSGSWSGFGVGGYGTWINADTDTTPSLGLTGQSAGATISGSVQLGSIVLEVFGDYGWVFGDLHKLGVDNEMALGGRAGVLVGQNTLVYALGAKAWLDTDAGTVDGWQYGGGVAIRFPSTPTELKLEYRHADYNTDGIIGVDTTSDTVRLGITYKFGVK